jgi:heme-degrading monooxygenase HmoA
MVIVIFRSRLREGANLKALTSLYERMYALVSAMPGFISLKDFQASDGEAVSIAEFASLEHVRAWREQSEHQAAQERGRREFFSEYSVQVCTLV